MADTSISTISLPETSTSPTSTTTNPPTSTSTPPPPPPPPSTSDTTTTTTTSEPTSTLPPPTSTSTSDTTTSTTVSTPPSTTSIPPTTRSIPPTLSITPGAGTFTSTSTVVVPPTISTGPTNSATPGTSRTFFQNTGAVAGVFTVVGLIVVGLLIALVTNTLRRRRAKRFDREIEEAAAEAAAVPAPAFLDDDDDQYGPRAYGGGYGHGDGYNHQYGHGTGNDGYPADRGAYSDGVGQYSDVSSHGTFGQPPMSNSGHNETYGMREMGPGPGELYNPHGNTGMQDAGIMAAGAGAAGIGVMRARSTREPGGYANALNDGASPYPAFATPGGMHGHPHHQLQQPQPQAHYDYNNIGNAGGPPVASSDSPGVGAGAGATAAGLHRGISLQHQTYPPSNTPSYPTSTAPGYSDLSRNQSLAAGSRSPESYASHYESTTSATSIGSGGDKYTGFAMQGYPPHQQQNPQQQYGADVRRNPSVGHSVEDVDPYGGYEVEDHGKGVRGRYADGDESSGEEDEGQARRVLKVANQ